VDTLEAIATRRSVGRVKPERPPRELIEQILDAATRAPNHFLTQPWRFFVLAGQARAELGQVMANAVRARLPEPESPEARAQLEREAAKPLRAPVLVVVAAEPSADPRAVEIEEIEATAAAVENLLLAAHALGLGACWMSGPVLAAAALREALATPPTLDLVALIPVGRPAETPAGPPRRTLEQLLVGSKDVDE